MLPAGCQPRLASIADILIVWLTALPPKLLAFAYLYLLMDANLRALMAE